MIDRYSRPAMKALWEPVHKYETWLEVELLVCDALEKVVRHDVIAFIESISEQVGPAARHLHMGLTSSDILDTSLAVLMVQAGDMILEGLEELLAAIQKRALEHRETLMIGRSHGIHG